jgi:ribosomal protein L11 methyltransferase
MGPGATADTLVAFRLEAAADAEEAVVTALWERGTTGVHVQPASGRIVLVAYFPERPGLAAELRVGLAACGVTDVEPAAIPDVDWVARFREGFSGFRAGRFHIQPAWDEQGERSGIPLRVLPGRAFGTGTHESTRLCLAALESLAARGPLGRVVDVGAGTGILAVAAALLGARAVTAIDIDADAVESARLHAGLNGVAIRVVRGDGGRPLARGGFDVVLANLTAPLLLEKRDEIVGLGAPSASLLLSGFLREDAPSIHGAYAKLGSGDVITEGEWAAVVIGASE